MAFLEDDSGDESGRGNLNHKKASEEDCSSSEHFGRDYVGEGSKEIVDGEEDDSNDSGCDRVYNELGNYEYDNHVDDDNIPGYEIGDFKGSDSEFCAEEHNSSFETSKTKRINSYGEEEKDSFSEREAVGNKPENDPDDEDYKINVNGDNKFYESEEEVEEAAYSGRFKTPYVSARSIKARGKRFVSGVKTNLIRAPSQRRRHVQPQMDIYDYDYDDTEEEEADDPADEDFNPEEVTSSHVFHKQDDADYEDSGDDFDGEDVDESFNLSDESDYDFTATRIKIGQRQSRIQKSLKSRTTKSLRPKRGKVISDAEEDFDEELGFLVRTVGVESEDDEFSAETKRKLGEKGGCHMAAVDKGKGTEFLSRETRTSSRSVPRKSYAEAEESEDEDAKKEALMDEGEKEEEDGDAIERVLWHRPQGANMEECSQPEPLMLDLDPFEELIWENQNFYIKWKGQSYLHCSWQTFGELSQVSGFKKVLNYTKKVEKERSKRWALTREEAEVHDVSKEMELELLKQYRQVERVFANRTLNSDSGEVFQEYLVKWKGLSYADSTWEKDIDITFAQDAIDEYKAREADTTFQGKSVESQRKKGKVSLRKFEEQPDWLRGGKLRDYQLDGLNFMVNSWKNDTNVILADEMGLGKTVQSVSMLGFLQYSQQIPGPFLVVVPLSTITNWAKEFRRWLPDMNVVVYVGNRASREMCQNFEFYPDNKSCQLIKFNALLTTYEVVLKDKMVLSKVKWAYLMVDEAHRLKNSEAALYTTLSEFNTKNKLLITGTPLQNSVEELWALLHFLDAEKFRSKDDFVEKYKNLNSFDEVELTNLHKELRPHLLRRVIKDVEKSLPPKIERILRVGMSPLQKQYYKWILERNFQDLNKGVRGNQVSLLNIVVELKKCCNHPFLFVSADHGYGGDASLNDHSKVQRLVLSSGKLVILDKLLLRLRETKHRVLIFSQMVKMLDILTDYLSLRGFQFQRLDGSTRADLRHQAMEHFNAPGSDDFCFLLSTRAGGLGINLATADTVIIFDSDWNPQNDLQAMSRAHRIGQQEVVNIYRFVTSKSVEEDILERAKKKMVLDHLVIQKLNAQGRLEKREAKKGTTMFDKNELAVILRFGAEELFKDEKEDESKSKLENLDIDEILARAEKVETKDGNSSGEGNELLNAFKVANFSSTEDDATFWSRLIQPDGVSQAEEALVPRATRNLKCYAEEKHVEKSMKRRKTHPEGKERPSKRPARFMDVTPVPPPPKIDGASARVCEWQGGMLSKKDASNFVKVVKKFGDKSRMDMIASEIGGVFESCDPRVQVQLWESLVTGCEKAIKNSASNEKGAILDFFGVSVKALETLDRIKELSYLVRCVKKYPDPVANFRLKMHPKNPSWSRSCNWNQVDDARILLGVYYHGYGSWDKIRKDSRLGLRHRIAAAGVPAGETFLPRAPNLDARVNALLRKELESDNVPNRSVVSARPVKDRSTLKREKKGTAKPPHVENSERILRSSNQRAKKTEALHPPPVKEYPSRKVKGEESAKEEGEISDTEEPQYKEKLDQEAREERWREWCEKNMHDHMNTLKRLEKLQRTSSNLPKDEVLKRVKEYLKLLGKKIELILEDHDGAKNISRIETRLWNYVATFSKMSGERLTDIYKKLKEEEQSDHRLTTSEWGMNGAAGPSGRDSESGLMGNFPVEGGSVRRHPKQQHIPGGEASLWDSEKGHKDTEAWKRRLRNDNLIMEDSASQYKVYSRKRDLQAVAHDGWDRASGGRGPPGYTSANGARSQDGLLGPGGGWEREGKRVGVGDWGGNFGNGFDRRGNNWNRRGLIDWPPHYGHPLHGPSRPRPMGFFPMNPVGAHPFQTGEKNR